jgi:hypothetical protein
LSWRAVDLSQCPGILSVKTVETIDQYLGGGIIVAQPVLECLPVGIANVGGGVVGPIPVPMCP